MGNTEKLYLVINTTFIYRQDIYFSTKSYNIVIFFLLVVISTWYTLQELNGCPTHWPDLTFYGNQIKAPPGLLQKQIVHLAPRDNSFPDASTAQLRKKDSETVKGLA